MPVLSEAIRFSWQQNSVAVVLITGDEKLPIPTMLRNATIFGRFAVLTPAIIIMTWRAWERSG